MFPGSSASKHLFPLFVKKVDIVLDASAEHSIHGQPVELCEKGSYYAQYCWPKIGPWFPTTLFSKGKYDNGWTQQRDRMGEVMQTRKSSTCTNDTRKSGCLARHPAVLVSCVAHISMTGVRPPRSLCKCDAFTTIGQVRLDLFAL